MMRDFHNNIELRAAIAPQNETGTSAVVSSIIDLANYTGVEFLIATGSLADSDATFTVLVEDGDNSSLTDNASVADAYLLGTETGAAITFADDNEIRKIGYIGPKRYVRLTITPAANNGDAYLSAVAVLWGARKLPRSSQT